jgi:hypothetical protein
VQPVGVGVDLPEWTVEVLPSCAAFQRFKPRVGPKITITRFGKGGWVSKAARSMHIGMPGPAFGIRTGLKIYMLIQ